MSRPTHNLCFGAKIRKIGTTQFCYIKVVYKGVYISQECYPDDEMKNKSKIKITFERTYYSNKIDKRGKKKSIAVKGHFVSV